MDDDLPDLYLDGGALAGDNEFALCGPGRGDGVPAALPRCAITDRTRQRVPIVVMWTTAVISVLIYDGGVERGDEKPIRWVGSALDDLRDLPADVQDDLGYQIGRVQQGWSRMTGSR